MSVPISNKTQILDAYVNYIKDVKPFNAKLLEVTYSLKTADEIINLQIEEGVTISLE